MTRPGGDDRVRNIPARLPFLSFYHDLRPSAPDPPFFVTWRLERWGHSRVRYISQNPCIMSKKISIIIHKNYDKAIVCFATVNIKDDSKDQVK